MTSMEHFDTEHSGTSRYLSLNVKPGSVSGAFAASGCECRLLRVVVY